MNISIERPSDERGLYGPDEIWVCVTGNEPPPDWPTIRRRAHELHPDQYLPMQPFRYIPGGPAFDADGNEVYRYEEWFILKDEGGSL